MRRRSCARCSGLAGSRLKSAACLPILRPNCRSEICVSSSLAMYHARWPTTTSVDLLLGYYPSGGCQPASIQLRRTSTASALLSCRAATVALPTGVRPIISVQSSFHLQCAPQRCWRGCNNGVTRPLREYRKSKATFHASLPSGASQHPASNHPAPLGATPPAAPERQRGSLAGHQQVAGGRREYRSRPPDDCSSESRVQTL